MKHKVDQIVRFATLFVIAASLQAGPIVDFLTSFKQEITVGAAAIGVILCIWSGVQLLSSGGRSIMHVTELGLGLFLLLGPNSIINWIHSFVN